MTIDDFNTLRDLPDKIVQTDLEFVQTRNPDVFRCEAVLGTFSGFEVKLTATYYDFNPSVVFNFRITGGHAICRYCVNHTEHPDRGSGKRDRTHKHTPEGDYCLRNNVPYAWARNDLSITGFPDVQAIWDVICKEANIQHAGKIIKY